MLLLLFGWYPRGDRYRCRQWRNAVVVLRRAARLLSVRRLVVLGLLVGLGGNHGFRQLLLLLLRGDVASLWALMALVLHIILNWSIQSRGLPRLAHLVASMLLLLRHVPWMLILIIHRNSLISRIRVMVNLLSARPHVLPNLILSWVMILNNLVLFHLFAHWRLLWHNMDWLLPHILTRRHLHVGRLFLRDMGNLGRMAVMRTFLNHLDRWDHNILLLNICLGAAVINWLILISHMIWWYLSLGLTIPLLSVRLLPAKLFLLKRVQLVLHLLNIVGGIQVLRMRLVLVHLVMIRIHLKFKITNFPV